MIDSELNPRQRIVETALRLFYQQGYRATGVNQIIAESEVAKATFYSHFPSKEKLCVAYLQARHTIWMQWLRESVERRESPVERIPAVFDFIAEWMTNCDFRGCAFLNIASEIPDAASDIRSEVVKHKDSLKDYLRSLLIDAEGQGIAITDAERPLLADMLYVLVEGAIAASQNYGRVWPVEAAREAAVRLLGI